MKNDLYPWVLKNIIAMVIWMWLAVYFNRWWIALFMVFCLSDYKTGKIFYRICDGCGAVSPDSDSHDSAVRNAEKAGWTRKKVFGTWNDYCPECSKKEEHK